jgi:excisionase family DNA binding protein
MGGTRRGTRLTQREAAERLGVSVEAIRKRVKRGTLRSEKEEDGRRYVYLDDAPDAAHPQADHAGHAHPQADHAGHAYPQAEGRRYADPAPLVEELRDQVGYLREQLRREQDAHAEARRIIAALAARIPEIEAPASSEEPGVPEMAADEQQGRGPIPDATGAQEGTQPRPWWRRIFGQ